MINLHYQFDFFVLFGESLHQFQFLCSGDSHQAEEVHTSHEGEAEGKQTKLLFFLMENLSIEMNT